MFNQMVVWQDLRPTLRPPRSRRLHHFFAVELSPATFVLLTKSPWWTSILTQTELLQQSWWCEKMRKPQRSADLTSIFIFSLACNHLHIFSNLDVHEYKYTYSHIHSNIHIFEKYLCKYILIYLPCILFVFIFSFTRY